LQFLLVTFIGIVILLEHFKGVIGHLHFYFVLEHKYAVNTEVNIYYATVTSGTNES